MGYRRPDGRFGVRNHLAVIPSVFCANTVAERIASQVHGAVALTHPVGCSQVGADLEQTARTLIQMGRNPNVGAVVVVGLGCERFSPRELTQGIASTGKPVEMVVIQEAGDSLKAVEQGASIARRMAEALSRQVREPAPVSELTIGLKCGGTDASSGIAANPATGVMSDMIVAAGGTTILSEVTELLGVEHILARRAVSPEVARAIYDTIGRMEEKLKAIGSDPRYQHRGALISPGNADGGVSSVVEKALGGINKAGTAPFTGVVGYAETTVKKGLHLMDAPGHDGEVVTGQVGGGAQIVVFTSGRGTPTGFPTAAVIKVTGNSATYRKMFENIDINAGEVIDGARTLQEMGEIIFEEVLKVASGKLTKAEAMGHRELFCVSRL